MTQEPQKPSEDVKQEASCTECEKNLAGWKRALADYDNVKKDLARERQSIREYERVAMIEELLPVLDHFDQAAMHAPNGEHAAWMKGILHVKDELEEAVKRAGVEPFGKAGDVFDSNHHDAVAKSHDADAKDQAITIVHTRGWKMGDRILRPARVTVNEAP